MPGAIDNDRAKKPPHEDGYGQSFNFDIADPLLNVDLNVTLALS